MRYLTHNFGFSNVNHEVYLDDNEVTSDKLAQHLNCQFLELVASCRGPKHLVMHISKSLRRTINWFSSKRSENAACTSTSVRRAPPFC